MSKVKNGMLKLVSSDSRRDLFEAELPDSAITKLVVKDDARPLGQHFHKRKIEVFLFLEGSGLYKTALVNEVGQFIGLLCVTQVVPGTVIKVPPWHAHRADLAPGTVFVCFSSEPFDPDDMVPCPI